MVAGLTNIDKIISLFDSGDNEIKIAVIDKASLYDPVKTQLESLEDDNFRLELVDGSVGTIEEKVQDGEFDGLLILELDDQKLPKGTLKANTIAEQGWMSKIESSLQQTKIMAATQQLGLNPTDIQKIYAPVDFEKQALDKSAKSEEELNQARGLVYILLFVIYFAVIFYGTMIATEVATEKSSRVMEILISSVSPVTQMFGKIFGVALLGLTQFLVLFVVGFVSIKSGGKSSQVSGITEFLNFDNVPLSTIVYAILFFLLGFILYATLLAMLGSIINRVEEANQVIQPVVILIVAAFLLAMSGLQDPTAIYIKITSYIPFFTPMIMFLRVGMVEVPVWEIALSIIILIVTIFIFAWIGAKVYRGGVLMYGKSGKLKDLKEAILLTKK